MKSLFGSLSRERVLTFIAARGQGYAREITGFWKCPDRPVKRELNRLESDGVLIAQSCGRTISYSMNPGFFLRKELTALLLKVIDAYPPEWKVKLLFDRRRGKPVVLHKKVVRKSDTTPERKTLDITMDRSVAEFSDSKTIHEDDNSYWSSAPVENKLEMITYLRECFYGPEATTGRLQRFFEFSEQEQR